MKKHIAVLLFLCSTLGFAREVSIEIVDAELTIPLEGALVIEPEGRILEADSSGLVTATVADRGAVTLLIRYPGYLDRYVVIEQETSTLTIALSLRGSALESKGLVITAKQPEKTGGETGKSVSVGTEEIHATAEIGLVEDVMSSVKLLPGVGYTGGFDSAPSIRGGEPGEFCAYLDGFYIEFPFYWGGAYSIFNPNMVESATLSHGIFPAKYGNSTSGVLEVASKNPDPEHAHWNLGVTTSALELLGSFPLQGKGGVLVSGKATYWGPFVRLAGLAVPDINDTLDTVPYIYDGSVKANYHFTDNLEGYLNGFFGADGIGISSDEKSGSMNLSTKTDFDYSHILSFLMAGVQATPSKDVLMNLSLGGGFTTLDYATENSASGSANYTPDFITLHDQTFDSTADGMIQGKTSYTVDEKTDISQTERLWNIQGRLEGDWVAGNGFTLSGGAEELFYSYASDGTQEAWTDIDLDGDGVYSSALNRFDISSDNKLVSSSVFTSLSYVSDNQRFGWDLGLRADHVYVFSDAFSLKTRPVVNPRLAVHMGLVRDRGALSELNLTLGTGLYSSFSKNLLALEKRWLDTIDDYSIGPNRSWTSVVGLEAVVAEKYRMSLEGYMKYGFNRVYYNEMYTETTSDVAFHGDGESMIWGADLLLRKLSLSSNRLDGWLSYSFNYARYRDPSADSGELDDGIGTSWYWPEFHRFHVLNVVLNLKATDRFSIMTHVGFASGKPEPVVGKAESYAAEREDGSIVEKYRQSSLYSDVERSDFSLPVDVKFTWQIGRADSKIKKEFYIAGENLLLNIYAPKGKKTVDSYTGESIKAANLDWNIGIPFISCGWKLQY